MWEFGGIRCLPSGVIVVCYLMSDRIDSSQDLSDTDSQEEPFQSTHSPMDPPVGLSVLQAGAAAGSADIDSAHNELPGRGHSTNGPSNHHGTNATNPNRNHSDSNSDSNDIKMQVDANDDAMAIDRDVDRGESDLLSTELPQHQRHALQSFLAIRATNLPTVTPHLQPPQAQAQAQAQAHEDEDKRVQHFLSQFGSQ